MTGVSGIQIFGSAVTVNMTHLGEVGAGYRHRQIGDIVDEAEIRGFSVAPIDEHKALINWQRCYLLSTEVVYQHADRECRYARVFLYAGRILDTDFTIVHVHLPSHSHRYFVLPSKDLVGMPFRGRGESWTIHTARKALYFPLDGYSTERLSEIQLHLPDYEERWDLLER